MSGGYQFQLPAGCPRLDFAGLAAYLDGGTTARIGTEPGTTVVLRQYGTDRRAHLPPVISVELRGQALAFVRPDSVRFTGPYGSRPSVRAWLGRIVADNGLGTDAARFRAGHGGRVRQLAIDGDPARPLAGATYQVPQEETEQEIAS